MCVTAISKIEEESFCTIDFTFILFYIVNEFLTGDISLWAFSAISTCHF